MRGTRRDVLRLTVAAAVGMPTARVWCYRTLADITCYPRPDPEHPDLLVGTDPPPVRRRAAPARPPGPRGPMRLPGERDTKSD